MEESYAIYLYARLPMKGTVDLVLPDGPLAHKTHFGQSRNIPLTTPTRIANCNSHGRRGFVTVADAFPEECAHVLDTMRQVYKHDEQTQREAMSGDQRLLFHQQHSGPLMDSLKQWMEEKLESKQIEPNGSLGEAFDYLLKRWELLTLFLRQPGAPLDNNLRAGAEDLHPPPQQLAVLQNRKRRPCRRPVHELHPHLPTGPR